MSLADHELQCLEEMLASHLSRDLASEVLSLLLRLADEDVDAIRKAWAGAQASSLTMQGAEGTHEVSIMLDGIKMLHEAMSLWMEG